MTSHRTDPGLGELGRLQAGEPWASPRGGPHPLPGWASYGAEVLAGGVQAVGGAAPPGPRTSVWLYIWLRGQW